MSDGKKYAPSLFNYERFRTREVLVGKIGFGGNNPIRIQSMTTTDTMDTEGTVAQSIRMIHAGCELVRITAPSKKEAFNLFENLLNKLKIDFVTILINLKIAQEPSKDISKIIKKETSTDPKCLLIQKKDKKISRNEKCEATGKKFKNCCGAL